MNMKKISKPLFISAAGLSILGGVGAYARNDSHRPKALDVYIFNTKSEPSYFLRTPDDERILIDGGANSDVIRYITKVLPFYSRRIDSLILTKADAGHVTGLIEALERYDIAQAYIPGVDPVSSGVATTSDSAYEIFLVKLKEKHVPTVTLNAGDISALGSSVYAKSLFPLSTSTFQYSKASQPELVLELRYSSTSMLIAGSISKKIQKAIASSSDSFPVDVISIAASDAPQRFSSSFVNSVRPEILIFTKAAKPLTSTKKKPTAKAKSVSNPFLSVSNAKRFYLEEKGTIHLVSDGNRFR